MYIYNTGVHVCVYAPHASNLLVHIIYQIDRTNLLKTYASATHTRIHTYTRTHCRTPIGINIIITDVYTYHHPQTSTSTCTSKVSHTRRSTLSVSVRLAPRDNSFATVLVSPPALARISIVLLSVSCPSMSMPAVIEGCTSTSAAASCLRSKA